MGRRKQIEIGSSGRRKPLIQLDGHHGRSSSTGTQAIVPVADDGKRKTVKATKLTGIGLLGVYDEDSDDSDNDDDESTKETSTEDTNDSTSKALDVDDQLAGFLAEINGISTDPVSTPEEPTKQPVAEIVTETQSKIVPDIVKEEEETKAIYDPVNFVPGEDDHVLPAPWSACYDEGSGFYYYWNCETNEVQWQPPVITKEVSTLKIEQPLDKTVKEELPETENIEAETDETANLNDVTSPKKQIETEDEVTDDKPILPVLESKEEAVAEEIAKPIGTQENAVTITQSNTLAVPVDGMLQYESLSPEPTAGFEEEDSKQLPTTDAITFDNKDKPNKTDMFEDISDGESVESGMQDYAEQLLEDILCTPSSPTVTSKIEKPIIVTTTKKIEIVTTKTPSVESAAVVTSCPDSRHVNAQCQTDTQQFQEEDSFRKEIMATASLLSSKLQYIGLSKETMSTLQIVFIELEARVRDWREGALESRYFAKKLKDVAEQLEIYESNAAPQGWQCHWNSEFKAYFYNNDETGESSWEYPQVDKKTTVDSSVIKQASKKTKSKAKTISAVPPPPPNDDDAPPPPPPPPADALPPPPPPETEPPSIESTPRQSASTHKKSLKSSTSKAKQAPAKLASSSTDPYRMAIERKLQSGSMPPGMEEEFDSSDDSPSELVTNTGIASPSLPPPGEPIVISQPPLPPSVSQVQAPVPVSEQLSKQPQQAPTETKQKRIKRTKKVQAGIPSKKLKKVSSLVNKWKSVKQQEAEQQAAEEEEEEDNENIDAPEVVNRRIEEWKKLQMERGGDSSNPNFQQVSGDWRERVRKAKKQRNDDDP